MTTTPTNIVVHPLAGVGNTLYIGTAEDCDLRIVDDPYVSPRHAKVTRAVHRNPVNGCPGISEVIDLGSTNGTWVHRDGMRLRVEAGSFITLRPGDVIVIGRTRLPWSGEVNFL